MMGQGRTHWMTEQGPDGGQRLLTLKPAARRQEDLPQGWRVWEQLGQATAICRGPSSPVLSPQTSPRLPLRLRWAHSPLGQLIQWEQTGQSHFLLGLYRTEVTGRSPTHKTDRDSQSTSKPAELVLAEHSFHAGFFSSEELY